MSKIELPYPEAPFYPAPEWPPRNKPEDFEPHREPERGIGIPIKQEPIGGPAYRTK